MKHFPFLLALALLVGRGFSQNSAIRFSAGDSLAAVNQVDSLIQVSRKLTSQGNFGKALEVNATAEKIALEKLGQESVAYGICCFNRGRVNHLKRDYPEAEKWYIEAETVQEKALGKAHADYAETLLSLGALYEDLRNFTKATPLFFEALQIRKTCFGMESPEYLQALARLLWNYIVLAKFEDAQTYCLQFQQIEEKVNGKNHPDYAKSQYYLGELFRAMSRFELAEPYYLEGKRIFETIPNGKQHFFYLQNLDGLGSLYFFMGRYSEAEPLWTEIRDIREKTLGRENGSYALSQLRLGMVYVRTDRPEKAEANWLEAKNIYEKLFGPNYYLVGSCKTNLGLLYSESGRYAEAEQFLLDVIRSREKTPSKGPIPYLNLARLYEIQARYQDAETYLLEALSIWKANMLAEEDPEFVKYGIHFLAYLYEREGRYSEADSLLKVGSDITRNILTKSITYLSEKELGDYLRLFERLGDHFFTFVAMGLRENGWFKNGSAESLGRCYDHSLFYKGFLLHSSKRIKNEMLFDTSSANQYQTLVTLKKQLAQEYSRQSTKNAEIQALEAKANLIEKELTKSVAGIGNALRQVSWKDVQQHLTKTDVAIEFVRFQVGEWANISDSLLYAALVLRPGDGQPLFIPLFEEKQLEAVLTTNNTKQRSEQLAHVYTRGARPVKTGELKGLYELIWRPLDTLLQGVNRVYFSPSGLLHRINFDAIPIDKKQILSDKFTLVRLGSTRSLVFPEFTKTDATKGAALFGGIQYDLATTAIRQDSIAPEFLSVDNSPELSFSYTDRSVPIRGQNWGYLPGTTTEVSEINTLLQKSNFPSQVFTGENATEEAFKALGTIGKSSPRILHLATHGFFFPDPKNSPASLERGLVGEAEPVFKLSDHPMIRSGLILAGANPAWQTGKPIHEGMEDGILTAYEISQMNLSNTELVVLSACETGLGDIQGSEGVYGLQRAFKIAGARFLIMSLWRVPDEQTSQLMTTFYKNWLEDKIEIPEAFRAAQKEIRKAGLDPYYWAGFVLVE